MPKFRMPFRAKLAAAGLSVVLSAPVMAQQADITGYLERQGASQRLATGYIGKNVYGSDGQRIGDVNDIIFDPQYGTAPAVVIGVGGLLGLGEKDVAVPLSAIGVENKDGKPHLTLKASKEDLRRAPAFVRTNPGM